MIKQISIAVLLLTAGVIAFTIRGNNDMEFVDENYPRPRGDVSSMEYMNKVCHDSISDRAKEILETRKLSLDDFCSCFAGKTKALKEDELAFALGFHYVQILDDKLSELDKKSLKKIEKKAVPYLSKYEKEYGIPGREVAIWGEASNKIGNTCI